jgi:hypothetical protein
MIRVYSLLIFSVISDHIRHIIANYFTQIDVSLYSENVRNVFDTIVILYDNSFSHN